MTSRLLEYSVSLDTAQSLANALQTLEEGDTLDIKIKDERILLHIITIKTIHEKTT